MHPAAFCERKAPQFEKGKESPGRGYQSAGKPRRSFVGKRNRRSTGFGGNPCDFRHGIWHRRGGPGSGTSGRRSELAPSWLPDLCYPRHNRGLYQMLETGGGLISEYPPGIPPIAWHFPYRNRIISGLSDAVLVVEARLKSGWLLSPLTMRWSRGRMFMRFRAGLRTLKPGCNRLISQEPGFSCLLNGF